jgi:hypothetical protein
MRSLWPQHGPKTENLMEEGPSKEWQSLVSSKFLWRLHLEPGKLAVTRSPLASRPWWERALHQLSLSYDIRNQHPSILSWNCPQGELRWGGGHLNLMTSPCPCYLSSSGLPIPLSLWNISYHCSECGFIPRFPLEIILPKTFSKGSLD